MSRRLLDRIARIPRYETNMRHGFRRYPRTYVQLLVGFVRVVYASACTHARIHTKRSSESCSRGCARLVGRPAGWVRKVKRRAAREHSGKRVRGRRSEETSETEATRYRRSRDGRRDAATRERRHAGVAGGEQASASERGLYRGRGAAVCARRRFATTARIDWRASRDPHHDAFAFTQWGLTFALARVRRHGSRHAVVAGFSQ